MDLPFQTRSSTRIPRPIDLFVRFLERNVADNCSNHPNRSYWNHDFQKVFNLSYSLLLNILFRLTEEFDGHQVAEMYWFPYILDKSMNPEILAGQQSQYNSKAEIRLIASDNMVSHGGLIDISVGDGDSIYKIIIGFISLFKIISMSNPSFKIPL